MRRRLYLLCILLSTGLSGCPKSEQMPESARKAARKQQSEPDAKTPTAAKKPDADEESSGCYSDDVHLTMSETELSDEEPCCSRADASDNLLRQYVGNSFLTRFIPGVHIGPFVLGTTREEVEAFLNKRKTWKTTKRGARELIVGDVFRLTFDKKKELSSISVMLDGACPECLSYQCKRLPKKFTAAAIAKLVPKCGAVESNPSGSLISCAGGGFACSWSGKDGRYDKVSCSVQRAKGKKFIPQAQPFLFFLAGMNAEESDVWLLAFSNKKRKDFKRGDADAVRRLMRGYLKVARGLLTYNGAFSYSYEGADKSGKVSLTAESASLPMKVILEDGRWRFNEN